jgi:hypothetical protein
VYLSKRQKSPATKKVIKISNFQPTKQKKIPKKTKQ